MESNCNTQEIATRSALVYLEFQIQGIGLAGVLEPKLAAASAVEFQIPLFPFRTKEYISRIQTERQLRSPVSWAYNYLVQFGPATRALGLFSLMGLGDALIRFVTFFPP